MYPTNSFRPCLAAFNRRCPVHGTSRTTPQLVVTLEQGVRESPPSNRGTSHLPLGLPFPSLECRSLSSRAGLDDEVRGTRLPGPAADHAAAVAFAGPVHNRR
jgi:hypothetical protein